MRVTYLAVLSKTINKCSGQKKGKGIIMKKRITSLLLAVMMAFAVVSTTAAAAVIEDNGIMPYGMACPECRIGNIRNCLEASVREPDEDIEILSCGCRNYKEVYREVWQKQCDNCTFVFPSETSYRRFQRTDNSNCRGNH